MGFLATPLDVVLVEHSTYLSTKHLKIRLFKAGLKTPQCEICGLTTWRGSPTPTQLHHMNGDRTDNRLSNLQILCPNCHAQTETFCGRNKKPTVHVARRRFFCSCGVEVSSYQDTCVPCATAKRQTFKIDPTELARLVWEKPTSQLAKELGVSDVAISKRCKKLGIAKPPRGYWERLAHREFGRPGWN